MVGLALRKLSGAIVLLGVAMAANASAVELPNGGVLSAEISAPLEQDSYTFIANAGDTFFIRVADTSSEGFLRPTFTVLDPLDAELAGAENATVAARSAMANLSGTFTVRVSDSPAGIDATGSYDIYFVLVPGADEGGALPNGGVVTDAIDLGDLDSYTFTASAGEDFLISVADLDVGEMRPSFTIFDPAGAELAGAENSAVAVRAATANLNGTYTVVVRDDSNGNDGTGPYALHFVRAPGAAEGGELPNGGVVTDTLDLGDLDSYTFPAETGETFLISVAERSSGGLVRPTFTVFDPTGDELASAENATVAVQSATANLDGTYTVVVRDGSNGNNATGPYDLHFARAPGANEGGALLDGDVVDDAIDLGDLDSFSYTATVGEVVEITVTDTSSTGFLRPTFSVLDPAGNEIASGEGPSVVTLSVAANDSGTFTVVVRDASNGNAAIGSYRLEFSSLLDLLSYAALGDSYSSGESVSPYEGGSAGCRRSTRAYPRLASEMDGADPIASRDGIDTRFDFFACTGAVIANVEYPGEDRFGEPPQLSPQHDVNESRDLVTLTIGGNDAQFGRIAELCAWIDDCHEPAFWEEFSSLTLGEWLEAFATQTLTPDLIDLYTEIRTATPNAATVVLNYPILLSGEACFRASLGGVITPGTFSAVEQATLIQGIRDVNAAILQATGEAGVHHLSVTERFAGHGVCSGGSEWITALIPWDPQASLHPNEEGHRQLAAAVTEFLDAESQSCGAGCLPSGLPPNPPPASPLLRSGARAPAPALPTLGELVTDLAGAPASCGPVRGVAVPGEDIDVSGAGFAANESVRVGILAGDLTIPLGNFTADANGDLTATVGVPASLAATADGAVIRALAGGASGTGLLLFAPVQFEDVLVSDGDSDGVPDLCDICPADPDASQADGDADGVGDACDSCPVTFGIDDDADGVCGALDNCSLLANPSQADNDADTIGDACDEDDDNDGLPDVDELTLYGTDPLLADTDGDGFDDSEELNAGSDPLDPGSVPPSPVPLALWGGVVLALLLTGSGAFRLGNGRHPRIE